MCMYYECMYLLIYVFICVCVCMYVHYILKSSAVPIALLTIIYFMFYAGSHRRFG